MAPRNPDTSDREIVLSRVFDYPRELVWEAWTDPKHVAQWWGPRGFSTSIEEMDVRPGGVWKHTMHGPDGADYPNKSVFVEVVKPERIVYTHGGGKKGSEGATFESTWTFEALGPSKTRLTMRMVFPTAGDRDRVVKEYGAVEGGKQTLERLSERLPAMVDPEFVITRSVDAPRAAVFAAWTTVEALQSWFGVKGMTTHSCSLDLRPGGLFRYGMKGPDGSGMWARWVFREIVRPSKLVFVMSFTDPEGGVIRAPFDAGWPLEWLTTLTFEEKAGRTKITVRGIPLNATEAERKLFKDHHESMSGGWGSTLDELGQFQRRQITMSRDFDAPRELVFQAWTDPKHVDHWMGPRGFATTTREIDVKPGGAWRYTMRGPDGVDYDNLIEYLEIVKPERLRYKHGTGAEPDQFRVTVTFEELGKKTRLTMQMILPSVDACEAVKKFGAVDLGYQTLDRLAEHLPRM